MKKTDWENYRQLKKGEVIIKGDEVFIDGPDWQKTNCVGTLAPCPKQMAHRIYRRLENNKIYGRNQRCNQTN